MPGPDRLTPAATPDPALTPGIEAALDALPAVRWSICVRDAAGRAVLEHRPDDVLPTASIGKVLLLAELARRTATGGPAGGWGTGPVLPRDPALGVGDSGLWQHLGDRPLTAADLAVLVGAVSDNWATNALLDQVGADAVRRLGAGLGLAATGLHDRVRDVRDPAVHPPALSTGTAAELTRLLLALHAGAAEVGGPHAGARVLDLLRLNTDLSMVAAAFGLDPLAHTAPDLDLLLANKTGTDAGIRADIGLVVRCAPGSGSAAAPDAASDAGSDAGRALAYAVLAHWPPDLPSDDERRTRLAVLAVMRGIGEQLDARLREPVPRPAAG